MTVRADVMDALGRVLGVRVELRADTPLAALGVDRQSWPPLAQALAQSAGVRISDADAVGLVTVGDVAALVEQRVVTP